MERQRGARGVVVRLACALALILSLAIAPRDAGAVGDPSLVWQTIETKHFRIHAHKRLEHVARRVADICESVNEKLIGPMGWQPPTVTHVVVTDDTDFANGSATALPYNTVRLYVTAPDDLSPLNDYDDWQTELITHEYTHILHTDHITGGPAIYNAIVGKQYSPNQMQPRWLLEGLAVLLETRYTTGGRNRSSIFDMYLRADVLEGTIAPIDQVSHTPRRWPQGNLWYLYGSHFLGYIDEIYGFEALRQVAADYSDQIVPFGINRAIHRATGKTYVELYEGWIAWMRKRYAKQKAEVVAKGVREGRRVTFHGQEASHPRYMPAAVLGEFPRRISYYRNDGHTTSGIYAMGVRPKPGSDPVYTKGELVTRTAGASTPAWLQDGSLVYDSVESSKMRIYFYWDLFRRPKNDWGSETEQGERLSFGLRANEPALSPDGSQVAYVVNKQGTTYLYVSDLDGATGAPLGPPRKMLGQVRFDQIYTPRWSPDGKKIAFSAWNDGGYRDVKIVDVLTGTITPVMHDRALDTGPVFSPDGRTLFFSSDRSGIANIYAYDLQTTVTKQVTNLLTGAFQPDVSPDGKHMVYVGYSHQGFDLFELDLDPSKWTDAEPYVDARGHRAPDPKHLAITPKPYNPWPTVRPYVWEFAYKPDAFGEAVTVSTRGSDVVGLHAFAASLTASFEKGVSGTDFTYVYRNMPWDTRLRLFRYIAPRGGYRFSDQTPLWVEQSVGIETGIQVPLNRSFNSQSVALTYSFSQFKALDGFPMNTFDPYSRLPVFPQTGYLATLRLGWAWSNVQRFLWSVGAEKGFAMAVNLDVARPELGGQYNVIVASYNTVGYIPMPWRRHHVLALHAQGGASTGDWGRRGAFVLGGFTDIPLPDALRNLLIQPGIALRGYKPGARFGEVFQLFNVEYRFPILNVDRGLETLPGFLQRLYGNFFLDYGDATFESLDLMRMKVGIGAELLTDFTVGYFLPLTLRVGYARGTSEGGIPQTYVILSQLF